MSILEEQEILLSQLVDHELPADQANQILAGIFDELADVLDVSAMGQRLKTMLQLRQELAPWRQQEPPAAIVAFPPAYPAARVSHWSWRMTTLAAAAVLGGVLVAGGFFLAARLGGHPTGQPIAGGPGPATGQAAGDSHENYPPVIVVTPEQRREIARAFALHESVAGPLSWYAADDSTIQVAPAQKGEKPQQPIAVVLRPRRPNRARARKARPTSLCAGATTRQPSSCRRQRWPRPFACGCCPPSPVEK